MPELVGFQTMVILDPNGMTFDAGVSLVRPFEFYLNLAYRTVMSSFTTKEIWNLCTPLMEILRLMARTKVL